ncbi:hypothetical protein DB30_01876 [Enhygromyxa salina]|uniref:Uncharacterized protein n=1 Tax=Enhygromyxa salina TaxID=215803 RepID=A0A0C2CWA7_9BACT|nr:hypothetical protein DB30_01876 [Enhygromyxa salina]
MDGVFSPMRSIHGADVARQSATRDCSRASTVVVFSDGELAEVWSRLRSQRPL